MTRGASGDRPLLLLHGGGVAGWMWRPLAAQLADRRMLIPDLPGHADDARDYVSHDATVQELAALLAAEEHPAVVVGFSLGAQLAVLLAARHPDLVADVVVISAQAEPLPFAGATLALLDATAGLAQREWFARAQARALFVPDALLDDYLRTTRAITRTTLRNAVAENIRFTIPGDWSRFPGEALVLAGGREKALMRRSAQRLHAALPHSALEIVDGCGHGIPLQRPDLLADRVERMLSR